MRCLGPAILDNCQQKDLEAGKDILIGRDRVFPDAAERALITNLWWVKEPYALVTSRQFSFKKNVNRCIPGSVMGMATPDDLKHYMHDLRMQRIQRPPFRITRSESRAYLKIFAIEEGGFRCSSHMQNIDAYLSSLSAENAA
jgi:hypothetical protein